MYAIHPLPSARPLAASPRCADALATAGGGTPPPPWKPLPLRAAGAVQPLRVPRGTMAVLECLQGRLWLTREGTLNDHFLEPGQRIYCPGPARIYVSTPGAEATTARWVQLPRGTQTPE